MSVPISSGDEIFSVAFDTNVVKGLFATMLPELPRFRKLETDTGFITDEAWFQSYVDEELKKNSPYNAYEELFCLFPEVPVYLLPGAVDVEIEPKQLLAEIKERGLLDRYSEKIFAFRDGRRQVILESRPSLQHGLSTLGHCGDGPYIDILWPNDASTVKIVTVEEYRDMLDRIRAK